jgi:hypothetical protein
MRLVSADREIPLRDLIVPIAPETARQSVDQKFLPNFEVRMFHERDLPGRGLEPLRIAPPDPKSGASANFATLAIKFYR